MDTNKSLWLKDYDIKVFEPLSSDIETDVCIIGAGLCGLLTAYLLKDTGMKIVIIDANKVASSTSAKNTGKITAQHGIMYKQLFDLSESDARLYKKVCMDAITDYKNIIDENGIDCDFRIADAIVYATDEETAKDVLDEFLIAKEIGFDAYLTDKIEPDIKIINALGYKDQATFHPVKFMNEIVKILEKSGVKIYENTAAQDIDDNTVYTVNGNEIRATHIVMSTHYPFFKIKGLFPIKMYQSRSFLLALKGINNKINNMYIDANEFGFTFKQHGDYLIFGGEDHQTGYENGEDKFQILQDYAKRLYPQAEVAYKWAAQDSITIDNLPYIGKYQSSMPYVYVATGFKKWGITLSMVAANTFKDLILNRVNSHSELFSPSRFKLSSTAKLFEFAADETASFVKGRINIGGVSSEVKLERGEGAVIQHKNVKLAVYRDEDDKLSCISAVCSHLGCIVNFNKSEKTWDCPCHGSRFDTNGNVLEGPAILPLKKYF